MAVIYDFPIPPKKSWEADKDFFLKLLIEDGFDPAVAEMAVNAFKKAWLGLMRLPSLHVETDKINFSGIPREQADSLFNEIYRLCNEGINKFAEEMHIVHRKVFYACLFYALELTNKKT